MNSNRRPYPVMAVRLKLLKTTSSLMSYPWASAGSISCEWFHPEFTYDLNLLLMPSKQNPGYDTLALERQRDYRSARRYLNITYFVNDPLIQGPVSIHGLGSQE
jgi:hypothetical protein